jgi:hypothetical protein
VFHVYLDQSLGDVVNLSRPAVQCGHVLISADHMNVPIVNIRVQGRTVGGMDSSLYRVANSPPKYPRFSGLSASPWSPSVSPFWIDLSRGHRHGPSGMLPVSPPRP